MRPYLEKLAHEAEASWTRLNRRLDDAIPFQWHHHPEYELTLTLNSRGQRFIGDHIGAYGDGDLVLVGPNLPHTWASREKIDPQQPHVALVCWIRPDWAAQLTGTFVEFGAIRTLLLRAGGGLQFSEAMAKQVRTDFEALFALPPAQRLLGLLDILNRLAGDDDARTLAGAPVLVRGPAESRARIDRVLTHIHENYAGDLPLEGLAERAALSLSGLHRMFRKHTQTTVSDYVARLRIGEACARLSGGGQPVRHIAEAVGYASLANFNRQFRRLKAMSPRQYRARFTAVGA